MAKRRNRSKPNKKNRSKPNKKNEAARLLGSLGGKARARNLSPARRREIARKAIETRWRKKSREG